MSDQLNFETRLGAAVKAFATNADGPVDATRIAASALSRSQTASWRARLTSIAQPRAAGQPALSARLLAIALVALVAVGALGIGLYWQRGLIVGSPVSTGTPTPLPTDSVSTPARTATPTPTVASPTAAAHFPIFPGQPRPVDAGTYDMGLFNLPVSIRFVVPAGWLSCANNAELLCRDGGGGVVNIDIVTDVFANPCDETTGRDPSLGPTVDDLVTAISGLPWSTVTQPTDVTVDGTHGKEFEVTAPARSQCVGRDDFSAWVTTLGRRATVSPGERMRLRILNAQGTRVVIAGSYGPGTTAEIDAIIDSVRIEPGATTTPTPAGASPTAIADFPGFPGAPKPVSPGIYDLGPDFPVSVSFAVPAGWLSCVNNAGLLCSADGVREVNIFIVTNVVAEPCDPTKHLDPAVGPTVDDLVTAISSLPWSAVTSPTDITVDGFRGKEFEVTTPTWPSCWGSDHPGWWETVHSGSAIGEAPGERIQLRILDVDGTRVVIAGSYLPGTTSPQNLAEINAIIDSVRIEP